MNEPLVAIDGIFFQLYKTGIAQLWRSLLQEWSKTEAAERIVVLDRNGTAPKFPGIRYQPIPAYVLGALSREQMLLEAACRQLGAKVFASSYYTRTMTVPAVQLVYDMIPEVYGFYNNGDPQWVEKHDAFRHAATFVCISECTKRDLCKFMPQLDPSAVKVVYPSVDRGLFYRSSSQEILAFHERHSIMHPYFLLVGPAKGYKNAELFFKALSMLPSQMGFDTVLIGGSLSADEFPSGSIRHQIYPENEELRAAYSGAVALVYPSQYEGFGLPILEAMACDCPVITTRAASLPEAAGEAAIYVKDEVELLDALCDVQKPKLVGELVRKGRRNIERFSWAKAAAELWSVFEATAGR